mmetsp:Transcript_5600/g.13986  ORF Transcript_5600/g.13986 Transcript_5600/m.13986 type:complete len:226 (+) Transcript_5600:281-958(+)
MVSRKFLRWLEVGLGSRRRIERLRALLRDPLEVQLDVVQTEITPDRSENVHRVHLLVARSTRGLLLRSAGAEPAEIVGPPFDRIAKHLVRLCHLSKPRRACCARVYVRVVLLRLSVVPALDLFDRRAPVHAQCGVEIRRTASRQPPAQHRAHERGPGRRRGPQRRLCGPRPCVCRRRRQPPAHHRARERGLHGLCPRVSRRRGEPALQREGFRAQCEGCRAGCAS